MNSGAVTAVSSLLAALGVAPHARLGKPELPVLGPRRRTAQYVRMSTDRQQHSIAFQMAAIAEYAALLGHEVVRTYADEGRSGLTADRRGLSSLLDDIGNPHYSSVHHDGAFTSVTRRPAAEHAITPLVQQATGRL